MSNLFELVQNWSLRSISNNRYFYGAVDLTLPTFNAQVVEIKGAGINGAYEAIVKGHYNATSATITLHTPSPEAIDLLHELQTLEARGVLQTTNMATGELDEEAVVLTMRGGCKTANLGKFAVGEKSDTSIELALQMLTIRIKGEEVLAWDPKNYIYRLNGKDKLEKSRSHLGIV